jgi:tRNA uridine 5-carbamoylmethylation protein Kti12
MPLVVMVGFPCSGKTRRAHELAALLEEKIKVHNDNVAASESTTSLGNNSTSATSSKSGNSINNNSSESTDHANIASKSFSSLSLNSVATPGCSLSKSGSLKMKGRRQPKLFPYQPKVVVINEESLMLDKSIGYSNANEEKKVRGALFSSVERHLSMDRIVILDSMNYIKGFRYQLHCAVKNVGTSQITVLFIHTSHIVLIFKILI